MKQLIELGKLNWFAKKQNKSFSKHINCWGFIFFFRGILGITVAFLFKQTTHSAGSYEGLASVLTTELVYHSILCSPIMNVSGCMCSLSTPTRFHFLRGAASLIKMIVTYFNWLCQRRSQESEDTHRGNCI